MVQNLKQVEKLGFVEVCEYPGRETCPLWEGIMEGRKEAVRRLRGLECARVALASLEQALQMLTPEELLILDRMLIHPQKGAVPQLCQILNVEKSGIYRRKDRAVEKVAKALGLR